MKEKGKSAGLKKWEGKKKLFLRINGKEREIGSLKYGKSWLIREWQM